MISLGCVPRPCQMLARQCTLLQKGRKLASTFSSSVSSATWRAASFPPTVIDNFAIDGRHVFGIADHEPLELGQSRHIEATWVALIDVSSHPVAKRLPTASDGSFREVVERFPDHLRDIRVRRVRRRYLGRERETTSQRRRNQRGELQVATHNLVDADWGHTEGLGQCRLT